jgi:hypothetical protein
MPTPLRPRVLAAIASAGELSFRQICIAIPDVSVRQVQNAASQLRNDGEIELVDRRYRLLVEESKPEPAPRYTPSTFIQPPARERLMAGR